MLKKTIIVLFILLVLIKSQVSAEQGNSYYESNPEELLFADITVASIKPMDIRETPGIVTVITEDEIRNSGARDLIDILRLVPGFEFGVDVFGVVGLGFRGNWAQEGKISLLWDGQEFADLLWSNLALGNHFPIDQIKQVEIIRGPGSVIYGGFAELAVINVVTRKAGDINGVNASVTYGQMKNAAARKNINISYGKVSGDDLNFVSSVFLGQGSQSDRQYTDFTGDTYNMSNNSELNPFNVNIGLECKGVNIRVLADRYNTTYKDDTAGALVEPSNMNFDSYFFDLKYEYKLGNNLILTPRFNYKRQEPWKVPVPVTLLIDSSDSSSYQYDTTVERFTENIMLSYDPAEKINIITGMEYYNDKARDNLNGTYSLAGKQEVNYSNFAGYLQGIVNAPIVNIITGARYENHSDYGTSFVPRIALTKSFDRYHFKILRSNAFRPPSIEQIGVNKDIKPESTIVTEIEAGYQFSKKMFLTANVFDTILDKPIIYFADTVTGADNYVNFDKVITRGLELECKLKEKWGYLNMNYSF
ncbi:MAG: hypothetical protein A3J83_05075, partial [Elusimicrobia bacterium RIFOXYA2_FULL_40_6]